MPTSPNRVCPVCQSPMAPQDACVQCSECSTDYHKECWEENGGCAVYGCPNVPPTEKWDDTDIPAAYWGQENKLCPACGKEILAAALRCRHCGSTFQSQQPESVETFQHRQHQQNQQPQLKRQVLLLFIFNLLVITAPVAAVVSLLWGSKHRRDLEALPSVYLALAKTGTVIGIVETVAVVGMTMVYGLFRA